MVTAKRFRLNDRSSRLPASIVLNDLSRACIPTEHFRSLCGKKPISQLLVSELPPSPFSTNNNSIERFIGTHNFDRSLLVPEKNLFEMIATEFILSQIGTVAYLSPSSIALAQIRNTLRGSPSVLTLAESVDYIFVADLFSAHQKKFFDAEPTSAAHFHEFLNVCKYMLQTKIVYGAWRFGPTAPTYSGLRDELFIIYPDTLVDLIMSDLVIA